MPGRRGPHGRGSSRLRTRAGAGPVRRRPFSPQLRAALPRIDPADVAAVGPRDADELAAAGLASLDGQLGALIRPSELTDTYAAALVGLPPPWWLHTDLDVLAAGVLAAVDYPSRAA